MYRAATLVTGRYELVLLENAFLWQGFTGHTVPRNTQYAIIGGALPGGTDPFSSAAASLVFSTVLRTVSEHNRKSPACFSLNKKARSYDCFAIR